MTDIPFWPDPWTHFADWRDFAVALFAAILIVLLIIWWRQQSRHWLRIVEGAFLAALILSISSTYLFQVPPHQAGCDGLCDGRGGYPLPVVLLDTGGGRSIAPLDFLLNLLLLWLLCLGGALLWSVAADALDWWKRSMRWRLIFVLLVVVLPWALLPRILNPPQPSTDGEELRLANNARRSAEFTYRITGLWVQRLALEDLHYLPGNEAADAGGSDPQLARVPYAEVCLRGYTYFYVPWRRYRIVLDTNGATALSLDELPLHGSCWSD